MKTVLCLLSSLMPFRRGRVAVAGAEAVHTAPPDSPANSHAPARLGASSAAADIPGPDPYCPPGSLDALVQEYRNLRFSHGREAETIRGMKYLGKYGIYRRAESRFGLLWGPFKLLAGFHDSADASDCEITLKYAEQLLKTVVAKEGDNALTQGWLSSQGYDCLVKTVTVELGIPWAQFVTECDVERVVTEAPVPKAPDEDAFIEHLVPLKKRELREIEQVFALHADLLVHHGVEVLDTGWLNEHKYSCVHYLPRCVFHLKWSGYLLRFGIYLGQHRPELAAKLWVPVADPVSGEGMAEPASADEENDEVSSTKARAA